MIDEDAFANLVFRKKGKNVKKRKNFDPVRLLTG